MTTTDSPHHDPQYIAGQIEALCIAISSAVNVSGMDKSVFVDELRKFVRLADSGNFPKYSAGLSAARHKIIEELDWTNP